jgi:hypothetical protein
VSRLGISGRQVSVGQDHPRSLQAASLRMPKPGPVGSPIRPRS